MPGKNDNLPYPTYKAACCARGLLADDQEWKDCLYEAAQTVTIPALLRALFVDILVHNHPSEPAKLWLLSCSNQIDEVSTPLLLRDHLSADFHFNRCVQAQDRTLSYSSVDYDLCLYELDEALKTLTNDDNKGVAFFQLPEPCLLYTSPSPRDS